VQSDAALRSVWGLLRTTNTFNAHPGTTPAGRSESLVQGVVRGMSGGHRSVSGAEQGPAPRPVDRFSAVERLWKCR